MITDDREIDRRVATEHTGTKDVVSDPAHSDDIGADWSDEGGATPIGPATESPEDTDTAESAGADDDEGSPMDLPPDDLPPITLDPPD